MSACIAYGCTNRCGNKSSGSGITFHYFPKNEERKKKWILAVRRKNWVPTIYSRICSTHFTEDMIDRTSLSCVRLRENAVPTLFDSFPPYLKQKIKQRKSPLKRTAIKTTDLEPAPNSVLKVASNAASEEASDAASETASNAAWETAPNSNIETEANATLEKMPNASLEVTSIANIVFLLPTKSNSASEKTLNATLETDSNTTVEAEPNATIEIEPNPSTEADSNSTLKTEPNATMGTISNTSIEATPNADIDFLLPTVAENNSLNDIHAECCPLRQLNMKRKLEKAEKSIQKYRKKICALKQSNRQMKQKLSDFRKLFGYLKELKLLDKNNDALSNVKLSAAPNMVWLKGADS